MRDFTDDLTALRKRLTEAGAYLDVEGRRARLRELDEEVQRPGLWDDQEVARRVTTEHSRVKEDVDLLDGLERRVSDAETLFDLAREESDESFAPELEEAVASLAHELEGLELRSLFRGEHDERDAVCEIHSGAGGTDAQDWAEMMLRMYLRWAERRGFAFELDDVSARLAEIRAQLKLLADYL